MRWLAIVLLAAACGSSGAAPQGSAPLAAHVAASEVELKLEMPQVL